MGTINEVLKNKGEIPYCLVKLLQTGSLATTSELGYWHKKLGALPVNYFQEMHRKETLMAVDEVRKTFGVSGRDIKLLDVGSGPRTGMTDGYNQRMFDLVAVDPLANYYRREFQGRGFLVRGKAEELSRMFRPEVFHIVHASNSLDHGDSPLLSVNNMIGVLKPGGVLMICGNEREGSRMQWVGMHQHDMWVEDDTLYWRRRGGETKAILGGGGCELLYLDRGSYEYEGNMIKYFYVMWKKDINSYKV